MCAAQVKCLDPFSMSASHGTGRYSGALANHFKRGECAIALDPFGEDAQPRRKDSKNKLAASQLCARDRENRCHCATALRRHDLHVDGVSSLRRSFQRAAQNAAAFFVQAARYVSAPRRRIESRPIRTYFAFFARSAPLNSPEATIQTLEPHLGKRFSRDAGFELARHFLTLVRPRAGFELAHPMLKSIAAGAGFDSGATLRGRIPRGDASAQCVTLHATSCRRGARMGRGRRSVRVSPRLIASCAMSQRGNFSASADLSNARHKNEHRFRRPISMTSGARLCNRSSRVSRFPPARGALLIAQGGDIPPSNADNMSRPDRGARA